MIICVNMESKAVMLVTHSNRADPLRMMPVSVGKNNIPVALKLDMALRFVNSPCNN